ncbi:hypothetical protein KC887_01265 [Candidatus Kaiserbacteria bacterium]|nr:hypothetical protein [Candidatus Kaiserbacteria bacterium]
MIQQLKSMLIDAAVAEQRNINRLLHEAAMYPPGTLARAMVISEIKRDFWLMLAGVGKRP